MYTLHTHTHTHCTHTHTNIALLNTSFTCTYTHEPYTFEYKIMHKWTRSLSTPVPCVSNITTLSAHAH